MNRKIFLSLVIISFSLFFSGCNNSDGKTIKAIQIMEEGTANPSSVEELKKAIAEYKDKAEGIIEAEEETGILYKILATKYIDKEMYGEALSALEKAVYYYPENHNLFYYVGVSAGYMAKAFLDFNADGNLTERNNYLLLAESGYKRAIELEPDYFKAIYGLSVLYVLEMNQPAKAIPLLDHALSIESKNEDAMMLLGHAYYLTFNYEAAVSMYDKVIAASNSRERQEAAAANKKAVLDAMYE